MMDPIFDPIAIEQWARDTGIFGMMNSKWGWPIAEIIHFFGLCLLIGTVGMFDLRMMGVARGVTMKELHRLVLRHPRSVLVLSPIGAQGFVLGRGNQQLSPDVVRRIGDEYVPGYGAATAS